VEDITGWLRSNGAVTSKEGTGSMMTKVFRDRKDSSSMQSLTAHRYSNSRHDSNKPDISRDINLISLTPCGRRRIASDNMTFDVAVGLWVMDGDPTKTQFEPESCLPDVPDSSSSLLTPETHLVIAEDLGSPRPKDDYIVSPHRVAIYCLRVERTKVRSHRTSE
jgi:hypothetical protein